tara:strand:+ start:1449 stop:1655 length:207 start_codon:yes stop_codon:yes gene_type:complete
MNIYRFAKYVWCWDIISGEEPYAYIKADTQEEAINKNNGNSRKWYDNRLDTIDVVENIPVNDIKLLIR